MIYRLTLHRKPCRVKEAQELYGVVIKEPLDVARLVRRLLEQEAQEVFLTIHLNVRNTVIGFIEIARGGYDLCSVDIRTIFGSALLAGSAAIIVAHNHPSSGLPDPSPEDFELTQKIVECGKMLTLPVLDHIIFGTDGSYVSLAERGLM